jgi:hypothetical protein
LQTNENKSVAAAPNLLGFLLYRLQRDP